MGDKATFDPVAKLITLTQDPALSGGLVTLDAQVDLYSDAKEDWLTDLSLNKYAFPFSSIGGNDLGGGVSAGAYYFLDNASGWRIKPFEADQYLTIVGNLFGLNSALPVFVPTTGDFSAVIQLERSSLTQQVVTGGGSGGAIADALLTEMTQDNGLGVAQYTANALALGPVGIGSTPSGVFKYDPGLTDIGQSPGDVRTDSGTNALVTEIYISDTTAKGGDATPYLAAMEIGHSIFLYEDKVAANFLKMVVAIPPTESAGIWTFTGTIADSGGAFTNNRDMNITLVSPGISVAAVAAAVWDEASSGHNAGGSFGKFIRQIKEGVVVEESTVNDAGASTTEFVTALSEDTDDHYNDSQMVFIDGALTGQSRTILGYEGSTKTITLDEGLTEAPADGDGFLILTGHTHPVTQIAQAVWDHTQ